MAAPQPIENPQRSYEVFEKKHYMECTTQKSLSFFPSERSEVKGDSNVLPEKFPSSNHPFGWMERKPGSLWSVLGYPGLQEPSRLPFSFHPPKAVKGETPKPPQPSLRSRDLGCYSIPAIVPQQWLPLIRNNPKLTEPNDR